MPISSNFGYAHDVAKTEGRVIHMARLPHSVTIGRIEPTIAAQLAGIEHYTMFPPPDEEGTRLNQGWCHVVLRNGADAQLALERLSSRCFGSRFGLVEPVCRLAVVCQARSFFS